MEIGKDTFVIIEYSVRLEDGSYVKGEGEPASMNFITGYAQILPGLERRLIGMHSGEEKAFIIPAHEAFGRHDPAKVRMKTFEEFPQGRNLEPGRWAMATNEWTQAQYSYFVKEKNEEGVVVDLNHPLAGKDLYYDVKVVHVREANQEELEYVRPCEHGKDPEAEGGANPACAPQQ
ncbi:MAG: peptidylprolyl isomerase [Acidobacteriota bacterium]